MPTVASLQGTTLGADNNTAELNTNRMAKHALGPTDHHPGFVLGSENHVASLLSSSRDALATWFISASGV